MHFGIYYAFWETEWGGDFLPYVERVQRLGFDLLEVACGSLTELSDSSCRALREASEQYGIRLTGGYGPRPEHDLSSPDLGVVENAFQFYAETFRKMNLAGIRSLGGALYSYWPVADAFRRDKNADLLRSVQRMQRLAGMAEAYGIVLNMEALNRFEGYLINTCAECVDYVHAVDRENVRVMLDTFHMNVEEDSMIEPIRQARGLLGRFHVGEANRKPPYANGRMPWTEMGRALKEIGYDGDVVMEPFVRRGGQVGRDISIWRDLSDGADAEQMDRWAASSVQFLRGCFS